MQSTTSSRFVSIRHIAYLCAFVIMASVFAEAASAQLFGRRSRTQTPPREQPVAIIDGKPITVADYEAIYARSNGGAEAAAMDSLAGFQDFLTRYVNYRLKVMEAHATGLAEDQALQDEITEYRLQLSRPYLIEQEVMEPLLKLLYERRNEMVSASHILIRVGPGASDTDTLAAYNKLVAIRDSIVAGADFGMMAERHSEDPSAKMADQPIGYRGYLGYFSGGRMVAEFEDAAYATAAGSMSPIIRTMFGYHVLQVHDRKAMQGAIELNHLLIRVAGPTPADSAAAKERLATAQTALAEGMAFADAARQYSDDQSSAARGGNVGFIDFDANMPEALRQAIFSLSEPGQISAPAETQFGFHLVQFVDQKPLPTFEEARDELKSRLEQLPRAKAAQEEYLAMLRDQGRFSPSNDGIQELAGVISDSSSYGQLLACAFEGDVRSAVIGRSAAGAFTVDDLCQFIRRDRTRPSGAREVLDKGNPTETVIGAVEAMLTDAALIEEIDRLATREPAFARTLDEFRDGLMLFRVMEEQVWTAAAEDTTALQAIYDEQPDAYRFGDRTRILTLQSRADSTLAPYSALLQSGSSFGDILSRLEADSVVAIRVDTARVEGMTNSVFDRIVNADEGTVIGPIRYDRGYITLVHDGVEPARTKTFEEAKTELTSVLQDRLESAMIARLRRTYDVQEFPDRLIHAFTSN